MYYSPVIRIVERLSVISIQKHWMEQGFYSLTSNAIMAIGHIAQSLITIDFIEDNLFLKFAIKDNALVKRITDLFKSTVWLEPQVDRGTTFYITFKKGI